MAPLAGLRIAYTTIGCKLNQADTDGLRHALERWGHPTCDDPQACDAHIINTCTVTARADRDCRKAIRRAKRYAPSALIVVVGCLAETDEPALRAMPEVDWVVRRGRLDGLAAALESGEEPRGDGGVGPLAPRPLPSGRARAQLVIQDGCDRFCSYCKVPLARGRQRSLPLADVVAGCRALAEEGYREIVLVGCNLGAWGEDSGEGTLGGLVGRLLAEDLPRLRLSSIEPDSLTDELTAALLAAGERVCPALHIAQQSGSPAVLHAMGRSPDVEGLERRLATLRAAMPLYGVGYDLLVGFPDEGPEAFEETVVLVEATRPSNLHVFPYSPREGAAAWERGDPIPAAEKKRRVARLIALGDRLRAEILEGHVGRRVEVVVDRLEAGGFSGLTGEYLRARGEGEARLGELVSVTPHRVIDGELAE